MNGRRPWLTLVQVFSVVLAACSTDAEDDATTTTADTGGEDVDEDPGAEGGRLVVVQGVDKRTIPPWTSVAAELA